MFLFFFRPCLSGSDSEWLPESEDEVEQAVSAVTM